MRSRFISKLLVMGNAISVLSLNENKIIPIRGNVLLQWIKQRYRRNTLFFRFILYLKLQIIYVQYLNVQHQAKFSECPIYLMKMKLDIYMRLVCNDGCIKGCISNIFVEIVCLHNISMKTEPQRDLYLLKYF